MQNHLLCFGLGYTASYLVNKLLKQGWHVSGSYHKEPSRPYLSASNNVTLFKFGAPLPTTAVTHILHSIPPQEQGDPVFQHYLKSLESLESLKWFGYLSTTGVYGNHDGAWVDEDTPTNPPNTRSKRRVEAEQAWLKTELPVHIFRLSGIYGPQNSVFESIQTETAKRIDKKGQVFSRIHVSDIINILLVSISSPNPKRIYNAADDLPAPQADIVSFACSLLSQTPSASHSI